MRQGTKRKCLPLNPEQPGRGAPWFKLGGLGGVASAEATGAGARVRPGPVAPWTLGRPPAPPSAASVHPRRPPLPEAGSPQRLHLRSPFGFRDGPGTRPGGPLYLLPAPASSCRAAAPVTAWGPSTSQLRGPRPARSNNSHLTAPLCPS